MAKILHVDDDPYWRENVQRALKHDHDVHSAGSYEDALEFLETARGEPYDLVLVDLNLVDERDRVGEELLDHLRAGTYTVRVIVMTGSLPAGPLRARIFDRYRVDEIIFKGKDGPLELRGTVEHILTIGHSTVGPSYAGRGSALERERFMGWVRFRGGVVRDLVDTRRAAAAELEPSSAAGRQAREALAIAEGVEARFDSARRRIENAIINLRDDADAAVAMAALNQAEAEIADLVRRAERD